jgi:hypothetical protein
MQAPAEVGLHEAAATEAAGVEDPVAAFLTRLAPFYEQVKHVEQLIVGLTDSVNMCNPLAEENPVEGPATERYPQSLAELEAEMQPIAALLASACATAADLGSLNVRIRETSSSSSSEEEEDVHPNRMVAALHFFNKTQCRIPSLMAIHRRLGETIPHLKDYFDTLMSIYRGKSADEIQEISQQIKLIKEKAEQAAGLGIHGGACHSLSDAPSSTGFKSVSPVTFDSLRRAVSPVLRPLVFVENFVDAAARLYSNEEYAGAVTQYKRAVYAFGHLPSIAPLAWLLMYAPAPPPPLLTTKPNSSIKHDVAGTAGRMYIRTTRKQRSWRLMASSKAATTVQACCLCACFKDGASPGISSERGSLRAQALLRAADTASSLSPPYSTVKLKLWHCTSSRRPRDLTLPNMLWV